MSTPSRSISQPSRTYAKGAFVDIGLGLALAVVLAFLLQRTGDLWFEATSGLRPDLVEWSAIALVALGLLVGFPRVWARISPVTTAVAGTALALAVYPAVFEVGDPFPILDGFRLQLGALETTYLTIGILFARSFRTWLKGA